MENIAKLRKERKLTQLQLAKILGVSTSTVAMWETGQRKPNYHYIAQLCQCLGVSFEELADVPALRTVPQDNVDIPVLGYVRAGYANSAQQNIIGYERVSDELAKSGEMFALKIKGDSMEPKMSDGDIVIVRRQPVAESGQTAVVMVGNEDATVKKVSFQKDGITLIPTNPDYMPVYYTAAECDSLPVTIVGVVVELRSRF